MMHDIQLAPPVQTPKVEKGTYYCGGMVPRQEIGIS